MAFPYLQKSFRWFGPEFGVSLNDIKQMDVQDIVTALHHIPTGEVWSSREIQQRKSTIEDAGLNWSVIESINVPESIKLGSPTRDQHIEHYLQSMSNLAAEGILTLCYNFMPVLDWTRTDLDYKLLGNTSALRYDHIELAVFDLFILKRAGAAQDYSEQILAQAEHFYAEADETTLTRIKNTILAGLPGTRDIMSLDTFQDFLDQYAEIDKAQLQKHLAYFLNAIAPHAEAIGMNLAIHPDDPPFPILGLPRIVSEYEDLEFLLAVCPVPANGLTFCTGSLGANPNNDLVKIVDDFGDRIHFIHLRNVLREGDLSFHESQHLKGSVPMEQVMHALIREQMRRAESGHGNPAIPVRPDHGHAILDDTKRLAEFYPGYSSMGRLKGLAEVSGLELGIRHMMTP